MVMDEDDMKTIREQMNWGDDQSIEELGLDTVMTWGKTAYNKAYRFGKKSWRR